MTIETEIFTTLEDAKKAKLRTGIRHIQGWRAFHTDRLDNGFWRITWVNGIDDPANTPQRPLRQITTDQFLAELAEKEKIRLI